MSQRLVSFFLVCSAIFLPGCMPSPYYQKDFTIPRNEWSTQYKPTFKFEITDTASVYNLYFIIRHTEAYPFSNIWIRVHTKQPGDSVFEKSRLEIPLADAAGKWLGRGMGEIWEHRMPMTRNDNPMFFNKPGVYELMFEQNMRMNPLPEVLQVGLRLEKVDKPKQTTQQ